MNLEIIVIKLWVEILPSGLLDDEGKPIEYPKYEITPKPPEEFEMRVCIFDTVDVIAMDVEGTSDVYMRCFFDSKEQAKETDTHFRC